MSAIALALALGCQPAAAEGARLFFEARGGWLSGDEQPWVFTTEDGQIHEIGASSVFGGTVGIVAPAVELFDGFTGWDVGLFARLGLTNQETGEFSSIFPETVVNLIGGYEPEDYTTAQAQHRE